MKLKPFFIGLSIGMIGGVATVMFTTPQSGKQLRNNISNKYDETKKTLVILSSQTAAVKQSFLSLKNEVQYNIPKIFKELKQTFLNFKKEVGPDAQYLKEEIESLQNSIEEIENNLSKIQRKKKN